MTGYRLIFTAHAVRRMAECGTNDSDVRQVVDSCETIIEYPDDLPYPSRLVLGWLGARPIHAVLADNPGDQETIVITVYEPDPNRWEPGFRRRRS
jgi:hypothetical protein